MDLLGSTPRMMLRTLVVAALFTEVFHGSAHVFGDDVLDGTASKDLKREESKSSSPMPCCFPYRFRAIIAAMPTFSAQRKEVTRLFRDWENKIQVQEIATFTTDGIERTVRKMYMDYGNKVQYLVMGDGKCQQMPIDHGMLEPCMPDDSVYLGTSYVGFGANTADFDAWYFPRTDKNRDIEMIVAVSKEDCVPITEHITGFMGAGQIDSLVLFTNVTREVDDSAFDLPPGCVTWPM